MKKILFVILANLILIGGGVTIFFASCEGPEGPPGSDGLDGNETCKTCHNLTKKDLVESQFKSSLHVTGNVVEERNTCAACHSEQGLHETLATGRDTTAEEVAIPIGFNCNFCHDSHQTMDTADGKDYALAMLDSFKMRINTGVKIASNQGCSYCHQPRLPSPKPVETSTVNMTVTSSRFGVHYGVQAAVLQGKGNYAFGSGYENSAHASLNCSKCHMAESANAKFGGHTFRVKSEDGLESNLAACTECHAGLTTFDYQGKQTEIQGLIDQLTTKLNNLGLIEMVDGKPTGYVKLTSGSLTSTNKNFAAIVNFQLALRDGSKGIHNYKFTKKMLENTIASLP